MKTISFTVDDSQKKTQKKPTALERCMRILTMLSQEEHYSTKQLAEIFTTSQKTIQNDIYKRLCDYPIYADEDDGYKLKFTYGYSLAKTMLDSDEMMILNLALSQFDDVADIDKIKTRILKKLLNASFMNPYFIKQDDIEDLEIDSPLIEHLESLIKNQEITKLKLKNKTIDAHLYKIANFDGYWYLFIKDLEDEKTKTLKLSHIKKVTPLGKHHTISQKTIQTILEKVHSAFYTDGNSFEVVIKVYPEVREYFLKKDFLETQKILNEFDDGSLEVSFEVSHDEDIDNIIKSWLPHVEILKPQRFRDKLTNELQTYLQRIQTK